MIHIMAKVTIRDLRTRFPRLRQILAQEGEIVVTDRGRPAYVLRSYNPPPARERVAIDYFARLRSRQPRRISARAARELDALDRGER